MKQFYFITDEEAGDESLAGVGEKREAPFGRVNEAILLTCVQSGVYYLKP